VGHRVDTLLRHGGRRDDAGRLGGHEGQHHEFAAAAADKAFYYKTGTNYDNSLAGGRTYLSVALA
jgi:hypothetical protein